LEKDLTIGYLGPEATFTHQAAMLNFGSALSYRPLPDIPDVFQAVEKGECDYGVVPIENSTEGAVNRSLDLLVDTESYDYRPGLFEDRALSLQSQFAR
jgi:chorismate mutase/prephenate dehydratase